MVKGMQIATGTSFVLSVLITPIVIALCKKYNWYDEVDPRKVHKGAIPRLGGLSVFSAFIVSTALYIFKFASEDYFFALPIFAGGLIIFLAGVIDDFLNLRAKLKFVIQIIAALIVSLSPLYFHKFLGFDINPIAGRVFTFLWILGLVNAYNLIDGLDWLCGGLSFLTLMTMAIILTSYGKDAGNIYFILGAAVAGFLVFNRPPAKIFLGDGGSQTLGYFIAVSPLFNSFGMFEDTKIVVMVLLTSIPVTDVIAAVWRRKRDHRKIFSADRAHIHHKLINIGFSKTVTVGFLLILQLLICFSSFGIIFMRNKKSAVVLLFVALSFVYLFFITIHYINRAVNIKMQGHLDAAPQEEH